MKHAEKHFISFYFQSLLLPVGSVDKFMLDKIFLEDFKIILHFPSLEIINGESDKH